MFLLLFIELKIWGFFKVLKSLRESVNVLGENPEREGRGPGS